MHGAHEVAGSNPVTPTILIRGSWLVWPPDFESGKFEVRILSPEPFHGRATVLVSGTGAPQGARFDASTSPHSCRVG